MNNPKHPKTITPSDRDLERNPGIGASKGTTIAGADPSEIEGENTFPGDIDNDTTPQGGVRPDAGRTNR